MRQSPKYSSLHRSSSAWKMKDTLSKCRWPTSPHFSPPSGNYWCSTQSPYLRWFALAQLRSVGERARPPLLSSPLLFSFAPQRWLISAHRIAPGQLGSFRRQRLLQLGRALNVLRQCLSPLKLWQDSVLFQAVYLRLHSGQFFLHYWPTQCLSHKWHLSKARHLLDWIRAP